MLHSSARCAYLGARCLVECREWEAALTVVERGVTLAEAEPQSGHGASGQVSAVAGFHVLAGRAHEALDNREVAAKSYVAALRQDVFCFEALEALLQNHMLSSSQSSELLADLLGRVPASEQWLAFYLRCRLDTASAAAEVLSGDRTAVDVDGLKEAQPFAAHVHPAPIVVEEAEPQVEVQAETQGAPGQPRHCLERQGSVLTALAEHHYDSGDIMRAYAASSTLMRDDPFALQCAPVYFCVLVQLRRKAELFAAVHRLVDAYPEQPEAWFGAAPRQPEGARVPLPSVSPRPWGLAEPSRRGKLFVPYEGLRERSPLLRKGHVHRAPLCAGVDGLCTRLRRAGRVRPGDGRLPHGDSSL